jgi:hypothetical protein
MAAVIARMAKSATSSPLHQNFRLFVRKLADFQLPCSAVSKGRRSTYIRSERRRLRRPNRILVAARDRPLVDDFELYRSCADSVLKSGTDCPACLPRPKPDGYTGPVGRSDFASDEASAVSNYKDRPEAPRAASRNHPYRDAFFALLLKSELLGLMAGSSPSEYLKTHPPVPEGWLLRDLYGPEEGYAVCVRWHMCGSAAASLHKKLKSPTNAPGVLTGGKIA